MAKLTAVADSQAPAVEPVVEPVESGQPIWVIPVRQVVIAAVAVVLVLLVSWMVVEDPVAHAWYDSRQHQRFSDFNQLRSRTTVGQTLAILQIPTIGVNVAVVEGDNFNLLRGGPGHAPSTPLPGQVGNSVIFGHRSGWGGTFQRLSRLQAGDAIYLQLHGSNGALLFAVTSVTEAGPGPIRLPFASDRRLVLVSGRGGRFSDSQLVVTAVSGTASTQTTVKTVPQAIPSSGSFPLNRTTGILLLRGLGAALMLTLLRKRYRTGIALGLASPLILATLLALVLDVDGLLSPLS